MKWWQIALGALAVSGLAMVTSCNGCGGGVVVRPDRGPQPPVPPDQGNVRRPDPGPGEELATRVSDPAKGRACHGEILLVDVPLDQGVPNLHADISERVRVRLENQLTVQEAGTPYSKIWLADDCGAAPIRVELGDIFAAHPGIAAPSRHQRLRFVCQPGDAEAIAVIPDRQCSVMAWVREAFDEEYQRAVPGADGAPIELARDCDARAQGIDWHLEAIGSFPAMNIPSVPAANPTPRATLLIADDGGTHQANVEALARSMLNAPSTGGAVPTNPTAYVKVESLKVLESKEGTATSYIAERLGSYIKTVSAGDPPVILNMSFGWPPEMGLSTDLREPRYDCDQREGPSGQAVRSALIALQQKQPKALAFAAIGNRNQIPQYPNGVEFRNDPCGPQNPIQELPFFPAAWADPAGQNCRNVDLRRRVVVGVGSHTVDYGRIGSPVAATLYAPGHQVRIPVTQSFVDSGTSYATAVASGLAARLYLGANPPATHGDFVTNHTCPLGAQGQQPRRISAPGAGGGGCVQADLSVPVPAKPTCSGTSCEPAAIDKDADPVNQAIVFSANLDTSGAGESGYDSHALGLAAPQPGEEPCLGPGCNSWIDPTRKFMDVSLSMETWVQAPQNKTYLANVSLRIYSDVGTFGYAISDDLVGGKTYFFDNLNLPSALQTESAAKTISVWLRYKAVGSSSGYFEAPLNVYLETANP